MEESSDTKDHIYLRALLSILPLVDEKKAFAIGRDLKTEAEQTSWVPTVRRISNFGLLLSTIGGVASAIFLSESILKSIQSTKIADIPIGSIGLYPLVVLGAVGLAFCSKIIMTQLQWINEGTSPVAQGENSAFAGALEFVLGALFFASLGLLLVEIGLWRFLYIISLVVFITGMVVAAIGMTFSGAFNLGQKLIIFFQREEAESQTKRSKN